MEDLKTLIELIKSLKTWSFVSDILIGVVFGAAILITYYWQKNRINALTDYIKLWNPSQLKQDMQSWMEIKEELHNETIKHYEFELKSAQDKESAARKIIASLVESREELVQKLIKGEALEAGDLIPKDAQAQPEEGVDDVMWTVRFRNGPVKRFKFPIRRAKRNDKPD